MDIRMALVPEEVEAAIMASSSAMQVGMTTPP
jgi:hypothetical protein